MKKLLLVSLIAALSVCAAHAKPVKIIFDTDMGNDVDDVLAQLMLFSYAQSGEVDLLGITINKSSPYAYIYTDILCDYYNFRNVPLAYYAGGKKGDGVFLKKICEEKDANGLYVYSRRSDMETKLPDGVEFMRKTLAAEKNDNEIVLVVVGFSSIMSGLLESGPDEHSELNGVELVKKKVKFVSIMAGKFDPETLKDPAAFQPEWNVIGDTPASKILYEKCPVPMLWSGGEVGMAIEYPHASIDKDYSWRPRSPVVDAYNMFAYHVAKNKFKREDGRHDRWCYDLTSVLAAVEDPEKHFKLSERGDVRVMDDKGHVSFTPNPNGRDRYLIVDKGRVPSIVKHFIKLCTVKPNKD